MILVIYFFGVTVVDVVVCAVVQLFLNIISNHPHNL